MFKTAEPGIAMKCEGIAAVHYDLYVLGLLDAVETERINNHVEQQCAACLSGVRRSMRLWEVFTSTLGAAEPSANFRERLQEIVGLSKSVLTFPRDAGQAERTERFPKRWAQLAMGTLLAGMLTLCGWYAGHTSAAVDRQQLMTRVAQSEQELSSSRIEMQQQQRQAARLSAALSASGQASAVNELARLQDRARGLESEVAQYKGMLERSRRGKDDRQDVLLLLSSPEARLVGLKGMQGSAGSVAYVLAIPNSKLVFVGSNLPDLAAGREYELWAIRRQETAIKELGVFVPDEGGRAYLQVDDGGAVGDPGSFFVTEEPAGGSSSPTGAKVFASEEDASQRSKSSS